MGAGKCTPEGHVTESNSSHAKPYVPIPGNDRPKQCKNVAPNVIANTCLCGSVHVGFCQARNIATNTHGSILPARLKHGVQPVDMISDFTGNSIATREFLPQTINSGNCNSYECEPEIPCISSDTVCYDIVSPTQRMQQPILSTHSNFTTSDASPQSNSTISHSCQEICVSPANCCSLRLNYPPSPGYKSSTCQTPLYSSGQSTSKMSPLEPSDDMLLESLTPTTSAPCHVGMPVTCVSSQDATTNTYSQCYNSYHYPSPNTTLPPIDYLIDEIHSTITSEEQATNSSNNGTQTQCSAVSHCCMTSSLRFNPFESSIDQIIDELQVETSSDGRSFPDLPVHNQSTNNS